METPTAPLCGAADGWSLSVILSLHYLINDDVPHLFGVMQITLTIISRGLIGKMTVGSGKNGGSCIRMAFRTFGLVGILPGLSACSVLGLAKAGHRQQGYCFNNRGAVNLWLVVHGILHHGPNYIKRLEIIHKKNIHTKRSITDTARGSYPFPNKVPISNSWGKFFFESIFCSIISYC